MTKTKIALSAIALLVIGFALGAGFYATTSPQALGATVYDVQHFVGDVYQGAQNSLIASGGTITGQLGGSTNTTLVVTTSTALGSSFICQYDTLKQSTSTALVTSTLPTAANLTTSCLTQDGQHEDVFIQIASGNNFGMVFVTSTGDTFVYNSTSTAGGLTLATSATGQFYKLEAVRYSSSSVVYSLGNQGSGH